MITRALRIAADLFFRKRYGHRAVVLETVAAVPGMVAGMLHHFKSLRNMTDDDGIIKELLDEAENERMHLMTFIEISKPTLFRKASCFGCSDCFRNLLFFLIRILQRIAHRMIGYFEEEAVTSYTEFLDEIDKGTIENVAAPKIAVDYWNLGNKATLRDVVVAVRNDEAGHRDKNHEIADNLL